MKHEAAAMSNVKKENVNRARQIQAAAAAAQGKESHSRGPPMNRQGGMGAASQRNHSVPFGANSQRQGPVNGAAAAQNGTRPRFGQGAGSNAATPASKAAQKQYENLPRTGIEYPIMKLNTTFIP